MRRGLLAFLLAVGVGMLIAASGGGDSGAYKVRAVFDNASFLIAGEDVKIAGVKVGQIASLDVTKDKKAAIVLDITDKDFQDWRKDASWVSRQIASIPTTARWRRRKPGARTASRPLPS